jgi:glycerol kinase
MGHNLQVGEVKDTFGTGAFLLMNTGTNIVKSAYGLLTTVLYKSKGDSNALYALEGAVETAGSVIEWLKNNMNTFEDYNDLKAKYHTVEDNGGVVFVPAFSGLYTPHWDLSARGLIIGLTNSTKRGNLVRATLEAIALRSNEVLGSFKSDSGRSISAVKVDGGLTAMDEFLQLLSDICNIEVIKPKERETTILGSAIVAGLHPDINIWCLENIPEFVKVDTSFNSMLKEEKRKNLIEKWDIAVERSKNWI